MIVMCPGCSGIDINIVKNEFKDEKIVFGCIGECGGRMDETIVAMVDGEFVEAEKRSRIYYKNKINTKLKCSLSGSRKINDITSRNCVICVKNLYLFFIISFQMKIYIQV